jgi:3-oxoadipate enol-lactonase
VSLVVERRQILVGGRLLSCLATGEPGAGQVIVFLHAFPLNAAMWHAQLAALPPGWTGLAMDFRGFGRSEADEVSSEAPGAMRMDDYASDVAGVLDALGAPRAAVCGCSMGGYAALAVLRQYPQRVTGLLLADTRATADGEAARAGREAMLEALDRGGPAAVAANMRPKLAGATTHAARPAVVAAIDGMMLDATDAGIRAAVLRMMGRPDATSDLAGFPGPVAVVVGEEDALTPLAEAESLAAVASDAAFVTIPAAGHLPNLEAPGAFDGALLGLLARIGSVAR